METELKHVQRMYRVTERCVRELLEQDVDLTQGERAALDGALHKLRVLLNTLARRAVRIVERQAEDERMGRLDTGS